MTLNGNNTQFQSSTARRMVYRHPTDHSLGGVCAGLADFLGWDPVLVRALWVVATFMTSGAGLLVYLLLWLLLPVGTQASGPMRPAALQFNNLGGSRMATVLLILGGLWLLSNLGILPALVEMAGGFLHIFFWPLLLIAIGYMLLKGRGGAGLRTRFDAMRNRAGAQGQDADMRHTVTQARAGIPLRRSRSNRMILGLCGGLSATVGMDANLIRLLWVVLALGTMGLSVLLYFVVALFVPEEGSHWAPAYPAQDDTGSHWAPDIAQDVPVTRTPDASAAPQVNVKAQPAAGPSVTPLNDEIVHF